ncbi:MAG: thiamine phosphate synthase [Muribaculaceae bacterium]|nr:thiamine phosphate synthase [Muribaculaceae bacterium]
MLQFLISDKDLRHTPVAQTEIALAGGCRWIHIPSGLSQNELDSIESLCRQSGAFLTVDDDVALTDKRRFHGVLLNAGHEKSATEVRAGLGAHAVVGVEVDDAAMLPSLMKNDIDYAVFDVDRNGMERAVEFAGESGMRHVPLVARGYRLTRENIMTLMSAGFNGILTASDSLESALPTEFLKSLTDELHTRF